MTLEELKKIDAVRANSPFDGILNEVRVFELAHCEICGNEGFLWFIDSNSIGFCDECLISAYGAENITKGAKES